MLLHTVPVHDAIRALLGTGNTARVDWRGGGTVRLPLRRTATGRPAHTSPSEQSPAGARHHYANMRPLATDRSAESYYYM
jgi:hypothetical protein